MQVGNSALPEVFLGGVNTPDTPSTGLHILQLQLGEVVELVIQNNPANAFNGDYR